MPNFFIEAGRPPALPPGQQLSPKVEQRPVAQVVIREVPRPAMVTVPYFMAVVAEQPNPQGASFNIEVFPGAPPLMIGAPILYSFSGCLGTCAREAMHQAGSWGWNPQPHPRSVIPVQQAAVLPPKNAGEEPPFQIFLDHIKLILSGALEDVNVPPIMRLVGSSGKPYIPCGSGVAHAGPANGEPCPTGPCQHNGGGDCVWAKLNLKPERIAQLKQETSEFRVNKQQRLAAMRAGHDVPPGIQIQIPGPPGAMAVVPAVGLQGAVGPQANPGQFIQGAQRPPQGWRAPGWRPPQPGQPSQASWMQQPQQTQPPPGWRPPQPGQPQPPPGWRPPQPGQPTQAPWTQQPRPPQQPAGWRPPQPGQPPQQGWPQPPPSNGHGWSQTPPQGGFAVPQVPLTPQGEFESTPAPRDEVGRFAAPPTPEPPKPPAKAPAKKAPAKRAPAKRAPAKKAPAKKG